MAQDYDVYIMACCLVYDRMSLFLRNWNNPIKTIAIF